MGDDEEGRSELALHPHQLELGVLAQLPVEGCQRLIEQDEARPLGQGAGKRHALALATGELVGPARAHAIQLHEPEHLQHALTDLMTRQAVLHEAEGDVLLDAHMGEQRVGLEEHVHGATVRRHAGHVSSANQNPPGIRRFETGNQPHEAGLAAARGPQQGKELSRRYGQRDVINSRDGAKALRHASDFDERFSALR